MRLGFELREAPVFLLCLECWIIDSRMTPFRRVRTNFKDIAEVEPDREVIALRALCLRLLIDRFIFICRQTFLIKTDLADMRGQMREVLRRPISGMTWPM